MSPLELMINSVLQGLIPKLIVA